MSSFSEYFDDFKKEDFLSRDLVYLDKLILSSTGDILCDILSEENWFLWNEKRKLEGLIVEDLYNLDINFRAYVYEIAICRRVSILKAIQILCGRSLISLEQAFRISPPQIMIDELIKPIDENTLNRLGLPLEIYGNGTISSYGKEPGKMDSICVNDHDEILYHWLKARKKGILQSDHILVHFDAHSDMLSIDRKDMDQLNHIEEIEEFKNYIATFYFRQPGKNLITPVNLVSFIYYAVKSKLIREIFWVYPDPDYSKYRFPANLDLSYLLDIDGGSNFRLENGHVVCDWAGVKVHIIRLRDLPVFNEEVILDIDLDFFLNLSSADEREGCRGYRLWDRASLSLWKEISGLPLRIGSVAPWITPDDFLSALKKKGIISPITTIALSPFFTHKPFHFLIDILKEEL